MLNVTEAMLYVTEAMLNVTEAMLNVTEAMLNVTEAMTSSMPFLEMLSHLKIRCFISKVTVME